MKKILFLLLLIGALVSFGVFLIMLESDETSLQDKESKLNAFIDETREEQEIKQEKEEEIQEVNVEEKIFQMRNRLALKGLIIEGDSYFREGQTAIALTKYLDFQKENPDDPLITHKIASSYKDLHKYQSALSYYAKIDKLDENLKTEYLTALEEGTDMNEVVKREFFISELPKFELSKDELFYYENSISCLQDFHSCKLRFQEYLGLDDENEEKETDSENLEKIGTAIKNYRNFQLDDVSLKNAYLLGAWYDNGFYSLSSHLGEQVLQDRPDYKAVLQISAQSRFNIGDYKQARTLLSRYYEIDKTDANVSYLLGISHTKLKDFVLANIFFNKALELNTDKSLDVRRRIVQNFNELGNTDKMLSAFRDIIQKEKSYTAQDASLAIYYHIVYEKQDIAKKWAILNKKKFPEEVDFYTYEGWIERENGNLEEAGKVLQKGYEVNPEDSFLLMNLGYLSLEDEKQTKALIYFKRILGSKVKDEFYFQAEKELDNIAKLRDTSK